MSVITKFVVVREGVEKMTFTSKKEADAYDKMLDIADLLTPFLTDSELELEATICEKLSFYLAENRDLLSSLLKGVVPSEVKPVKKTVKKGEPKK